MGKLNLYMQIKNFISSFGNTKENEVDRGYQLTEDDLGDYLKNFLTKEIKDTMLSNINSVGYLPSELAKQLKEYINNPDYDLYIKSVHDSFVESIFNTGIRCYGNTSVLATINPQNLKEISIEHTITKMDLFPVLISNIKGNNGMSQGFVDINGTLILLVPKGTPKEDMLYFNEDTKTYNVKPSYIVGFIPVDDKGIVSDWILNPQFNNTNSHKR